MVGRRSLCFRKTSGRVTLRGASLALEVAALLGAVLARGDRSFRPLAILLLVGVLGDVAMRLLHDAAWQGGVAADVYRGILLAWPAALAGVTGRVFLPASSPPRRLNGAGPGKPVSPAGNASAVVTGARVLCGWAVLVSSKTKAPIGFPMGPRTGMPNAVTSREMPRTRTWWLDCYSSFIAWALASALLPFALAGATLPLLHAAHGLAVVIAGVAVARAWRRTWGQAHAAVLLLVCSELVCVTVGPWVDRPAASWAVARAVYCVGFGVLVLAFWGVTVGALLAGAAVAVAVEPMPAELAGRAAVALACSALALSVAAATTGWQRVAHAEGRVGVRHRVGRALAALLHGR